ncbi:hypothetical protein SCHPADRAFT_917267 [Schizopora paradoxa]|uniref:Uncharacterized protein n=1 Tax=Schizopora paradoxa TaxID=27342 RepID=A0A0H2RCV6_9AGAM|nr:hypothetical protein SCHPADRAFT_917267 [Schizopora paradoxa]
MHYLRNILSMCSFFTTRNTVRFKDFVGKSPRCVVIKVLTNGSEVVALLGTGSRADFILLNLADQLKLSRSKLEKPLKVQLAVSGSVSYVNYSTNVHFAYQEIGTHKVMLTMNPSQIVIGSTTATPLTGPDVATIQSRAAELAEPTLEALHTELMEYATPICKEVIDTPLPPLRAINHQTPLINKMKTYSWRPSKCSEPLKPLRREKRKAY